MVYTLYGLPSFKGFPASILSDIKLKHFTALNLIKFLIRCPINKTTHSLR
jgi:hypothetical protein